MRSSCFAEEDVGLSSVAGTSSNNPMNIPCLSRSRRANSYRSLSSLSYSSSSFSSRLSARLFDVRGEEHQPHFLEACFLCKAPLGDNRDIFMYRGDTPFCTEECRQEQIEIDEANENKLKLSYSMKAMRNEITKSTSNKSQNYQARTNPVAAS